MTATTEERERFRNFVWVPFRNFTRIFRIQKYYKFVPKLKSRTTSKGIVFISWTAVKPVTAGISQYGEWLDEAGLYLRQG
jgi:hypothetical protein